MSSPRSKLVATWLAVLGGSLGLHRFYLRGTGDPWAWLHALPALVGAYGFWRMREIGTDDRLGSLLVPLLGAAVAAGMLAALVYGLTPDERWDERQGLRAAPTHSGWATVAGVVVALALGATVTMATIAFCAQRYFEWRAPG
ncbi:MAG: TM2 domain-containing protein [Caldimonas sp.]